MQTINRTPAEVRELQRMLIGLGFDVGAPGADGVMGPRTLRAYEQYLDTRPEEPAIMLPNAAIPWWQSKAMWSSLATVAGGVATLAAVVGTGGAAAIAAPEAIGAIAAIITGAGGIYGTAVRKAPIDPNLVVGSYRITRSAQ